MALKFTLPALLCLSFLALMPALPAWAEGDLAQPVTDDTSGQAADAAAVEPDPGLLIPHYEVGGEAEAATARQGRTAVRFIAARNDPPFVFERRGLALGLYVDVVRELCSMANLACVIDLIPEELGERDVLIAALSHAHELGDRYEFSQPLVQNTGRFLVRTDSALDRAWPEDLGSARIGVIDAGPHADFMAKVMGLEPADRFANLAAAIEALETGAIDALFADALRLNFFLTTEQGSCCRLLPGAYTDPGYFREMVLFAVAEDNLPLYQLMTSGLDNLTRTRQRWEQIYLKYFPFGLY